MIKKIACVIGLAGLVWMGGAMAQAVNPRVEIDTSVGNITLELYADKAPKTVENFLHYVKKHQYDGLLFHRVIRNFMIQGGGLNQKMVEIPTGPPIVNEADNGLKNEVGTIAMAREPAPNSATAQFFINTADNTFLDHIAVPPEGITRTTRQGEEQHIGPEQADRVFGYAVFGKVIDGLDVVRIIEKSPTHTVGPNADVPYTPVVIKTVKLLAKE